MENDNSPDVEAELFAHDTVLSEDDESGRPARYGNDALPDTVAGRRKRERSDLTLVDVEPSGPEFLLADTVHSGDEGGIRALTASPESKRFTQRYTAGRLLGRGGMGEVRLYHDKMVGRDIAVKTAIASGDGRPSPAQRRFAREARIQAQLEHPSIVPVYDVGVDPAGALYFTMKRVRGISLAEVLAGLKEGDPELGSRYTRRRLLTIFSNLCIAVDFCHQKGVVHRDLKPSNVMLGSFGEVFLLDWGLAAVGKTPARRSTPRVERESAGPSEHVTGTPGYMAPEQIEDASSVDARADVYALGVILFELLTLERLHAPPAEQALASTLELDGESPATRAPERDIPPELDRLCAQATRRDPELRLSSAAALSSGVEAYLDGNRDLELRRALAASHAAEGEAALERANSGHDEHDEHDERTRAMREATAALGLDANNRAALRTLMRLIAEPPRTIPEAAQREIDAERRMAHRNAARTGLTFYFSYLLYLPLLLWMGIRDSQLFALGWICIGACAAATVWTLRRPPKHLDVPLVHLVVATFTVGAVSVLFGPFVLVPMIALASGVSYLSAFDDRRGLVPWASCAAVLVPAVLVWLDVIPSPYVFEDGKWAILPSVFYISAVPTQTYVTVAVVATIFPALVFVARMRRDFTDAHTKLQLQAWQLRRMLPDDAHQETDAPPVSAPPPSYSEPTPPGSPLPPTRAE